MARELMSNYNYVSIQEVDRIIDACYFSLDSTTRTITSSRGYRVNVKAYEYTLNNGDTIICFDIDTDKSHRECDTRKPNWRNLVKHYILLSLHCNLLYAGGYYAYAYMTNKPSIWYSEYLDVFIFNRERIIEL